MAKNLFKIAKQKKRIVDSATLHLIG